MGRKSKELSTNVKEMIVESYKSNRNVSELSRIFGIPRRTIGSVIKKFNDFGSVENRSGRGRKKLFSDRDVSQLSRVAKQNRRRSLQDITSIINEGRGHSFCTKTVQRKLTGLGFKRRVAKKQVGVREVNKKKRVAWARERKHWTVDEVWRWWIFSDESQIVIGKNNRVYIWRKDSEVNSPHLVCPAPRGRLSLMVWGCICYGGVGTLTHVQGKINAQKYIDIIDNNLWPVIARHFPDDNYTFMDDNAPVHRAHIVCQYMENNNIHHTVWPAQSPDMNPIENIWLKLKRDIEKQTANIHTENELMTVVRHSWESIPPSYVQELYSTIPARLQEVIRMKGNLTKF